MTPAADAAAVCGAPPEASPTHGVVLAPSVSHALRAEKALLEAGLPVKLIPTPRQLSSDCGVAIRFPWPRRDAVQRALKDAGLDYDHLLPLS